MSISDQYGRTNFSNDFLLENEITPFYKNVQNILAGNEITIEVQSVSSRALSFEQAFVESLHTISSPTGPLDKDPKLTNSWWLYSDAKFLVNGEVLEQVNEPGAIADVNRLMEKTRTAIQNSQHEGYYPPYIGVAGDHPDILERPSNSSQSSMMWLADVFGFADLPKSFFGTATYSLRLTPKSNSELKKILFKSDADVADLAMTVSYQDLILWCPLLKPSAEQALQLAMDSKGGKPMHLDFLRTYYERKTAQNRTTGNIVIHSGINKPRRVIVAFRKDEAPAYTNYDREYTTSSGRNTGSWKINGDFSNLKITFI